MQEALIEECWWGFSHTLDRCKKKKKRDLVWQSYIQSSFYTLWLLGKEWTVIETFCQLGLLEMCSKSCSKLKVWSIQHQHPDFIWTWARRKKTTKVHSGHRNIFITSHSTQLRSETKELEGGLESEKEVGGGMGKKSPIFFGFHKGVLWLPVREWQGLLWWVPTLVCEAKQW